MEPLRVWGNYTGTIFSPDIFVNNSNHLQLNLQFGQGTNDPSVANSVPARSRPGRGDCASSMQRPRIRPNWSGVGENALAVIRERLGVS
jgi:hypothetical protein